MPEVVPPIPGQNRDSTLGVVVDVESRGMGIGALSVGRTVTEAAAITIWRSA